MINTLDDLLTFENIYLFANWGVVPFWLLLIFIPNHSITKFFCSFYYCPLLLALLIFLFTQIFLEGNIFEGFKLYLGLDGLDEIYSNESLRLSVLATLSCYKFICWSLDCKRSAKIYGT